MAQYVDMETGEVVDVDALVKEEVKNVLDKQRKQKLEWKAKMEEHQKKAEITFFNNDMQAVDMLQEHLTRAQRGLFVILCCYMNYDNMVVHVKHGNKPLTKPQIQKVLNCPKRTLYDFLEACTKGGILWYDEEEESYIVNPKVAFKGQYKYSDKEVVSMKVEMKNLLGHLTPTQIGLLYDLQPYINIKYETLCKNPNETEWSRIKHLTPKTLAAELGMSSAKLNQQLSKLKVDGKMIVQKVGYGNRSRYLMNPNYIFRGSWKKAIANIRQQCDNKTIVSIFSESGDEE